MLVSPSVLSCDFSILKEEVKSISTADFIHLDVMDGLFVKNLTFGAKLVKDLRKHTNIPFDVHLMILNPIDYIKDFVDAGSDMITFHFEANSDILKTINRIKSFGVKVGLSIKPNTSVSEVKEFLPLLDLVLVMSVEPGFGGQAFMESSLLKIKELNEFRTANKLSYLIEVDGGINDKNIGLVKEAKADIVVAGSYIFNDKDRNLKIKSLK